MSLPAVTGPDMALALLMHNLGLEKIPVILCSGALRLNMIAAEVGTPYFLAKPYGFDALSRVLATALSERRPPSRRA